MGDTKKNNNSGGRPRLETKVKKTETLTARLTGDQYDWILKQAELYGLKPSTLLTECVRFTFECVNNCKPSTSKFPDADVISRRHQVSIWRKPLLSDDDKIAMATCNGVLTECHHFLSAELKGLRHADRLKHFQNNPEKMAHWISYIYNLYSLLWNRLWNCDWPTIHKTKAKFITKDEVLQILSSMSNSQKNQKP